MPNTYDLVMLDTNLRKMDSVCSSFLLNIVGARSQATESEKEFYVSSRKDELTWPVNTTRRHSSNS